MTYKNCNVAAIYRSYPCEVLGVDFAFPAPPEETPASQPHRYTNNFSLKSPKPAREPPPPSWLQSQHQYPSQLLLAVRVVYNDAP